MEASEFLSTSPSCAITSYARGATPQICCPPSGFANYNYTVGAILLRHMACRRNSQHALEVVVVGTVQSQTSLFYRDTGRTNLLCVFTIDRIRCADDVRLPISQCFFFSIFHSVCSTCACSMSSDRLSNITACDLRCFLARMS